MSGDKSKKGRVQSRNPEARHESKVCGTHPVEEGGKTADETLPVTISSLRQVVGEVVADGTRDLKLELRKELAQVKMSVKEEMKDLLNEMTSEINQQVSTAINKTEELAKRLGEIEKGMAKEERWDCGVRDAIAQLLSEQKLLREKVTDLEGRSRRNNLRIYGIPENAEGTSMLRPKVITAEMINNLLPVDVVGPRRGGSAPGLREKAREKLRAFQRPGGEDVVVDE
ncbi:unnamed protein product [Menidia menidia]|uniref:(Atlantic silverside) hypothetical protein n=1 Tax=Menidia menidia TaxID=238744 RepID=A0A8S4ABC4_9TELE|nr:unnamed protein product [Menidia menidia]